MDDHPFSQTKDYSIKIPREVLESALSVFKQEANLLRTTEPYHSILKIENDGESRYTNQDIFLSEYSNNISSALFYVRWITAENNDLTFSIRFRHSISGDPSTTIELSLLSRAAVDRIFKHFQDFYDHKALQLQSTSYEPNEAKLSSYSLIRRLPSVSIKPEGIHKLEVLLTSLSREFERGYNLKGDFTVDTLITDSQGCESLPSFTIYGREYFPDDTRRISMRLTPLGSDSLKIQFDLDRNYTIIEVTRQSKNSRSEAKKTVDDVLHVLKDYENGNWFLNPPFLIWYIISLLSYSTLGLAIITIRVLPAITASYFSFFIGTQLYLYSCKIKPYTQFYTRRNESVSKWFNWFIFVLLEFLLISVIFATMVSKLSGK
jgi:hypothetical protein